MKCLAYNFVRSEAVPQHGRQVTAITAEMRRKFTERHPFRSAPELLESRSSLGAVSRAMRIIDAITKTIAVKIKETRR